jgi:predicted TIM-barrel fold metal-dependent hydrolase
LRLGAIQFFLFSALFSCVKPSGSDMPLPIVDSHVHLSPDPQSVDRALEIFDKNGITRFCVKSAGFYPTARFQATLALKKKLGDRFAFFSNIDWRDIDEPSWAQREVTRLEAAVRLGARGVKIFKALGLGVRTRDGKLLAVDDPVLDPIFEKAAELGALVAIHTSDPKKFFEPNTPDNERYFELLFAPSWGFQGKDFPTKESLLAARDRLLKRHPKTTFLGIHLANNPEDIEYVDRLLDNNPNLYIDTSARVPEFGRHPSKQVRDFFIKHQDRILFGSDIVIEPDELQLGSLSIWPTDDLDAARFYHSHREYFESDHRKIDTPTPIQGFWKVDGIALPPAVLKKIYQQNAERLIWKAGS